MTHRRRQPQPAGAARRSLLRDGRFLRLWSATTASGLATWAFPFVLGLAVVDGTLSAAALGLVLATRTAGFLIAVPFAGVFADRHSRRRVARAAGLAAAAGSVVVAISLATASVVGMAVAAVVVGVGQGACRPAFQALVAEVVAPDRRQQANAAITFAVRGSTLLAPALTALLGTVLSAPILLAGVGLGWLIAAVVPPAGRHEPGRAEPDGSSRSTGRFLTQLADGAREARRHPWFVAGLLALTVVISTGYSATGVALPLVSRASYGTEAVLAAALTAYTAGALLGAALMARWRPRSEGWVALAGLACYGLAPVSLLLQWHPATIVVAYLITGIGIELFNVPWFTATQREVAPDKLARVSSLDFLLSYGFAPIGLAIIAPAIDALGIRPVLIVCALCCFLAPAVAAIGTGTARYFATDHQRPVSSTPR